MRAATLLMAILAGATLGGCLGTPDDDGPAEEPAAWRERLHGVSQPTVDPATLLFEQHRIVVRDEIELDAWLMVPPAGASDNVDGTFPLVIHLTPYWGGGDPHNCFSVPGVTADRACSIQYWPFVERGYAYALVSMRGTGNSGGCFTTGGPTEAFDSVDAIEYFASLPWSNGNVGAIGLSYDGTTANDVWVEAPPSLKATVPISAIAEFYEYAYVNGVHRAPQGYTPFTSYYWPIVGLAPVGVEGGVQTNDPAYVPGAMAGEACGDHIERDTGGAVSVPEPTITQFWLDRDFNHGYATHPEPERERPAVLLVHGLQDWNAAPYHIDPWIETIRGSGVDFRMVLGQWGHTWPWSDDWRTLVTAFFDTHLKGRDVGLDAVPNVFVEDTNGDWRAEDAWPPAKLAPARLYLGAAGDLRGEDVGPDTGTASFLEAPGGVLEPTLRWVSEPFEADTRLSGNVGIHAPVTADGQRAHIVWSLGVAGPDGTPATERIWTWVPQSLNLYEDPMSWDADVTGKTFDLDLRFAPAELFVGAGERLVLYAGDAPKITHNSDSLAPFSTIQTVDIDLSEAWLTLPIDPSVTVLPDAVFCTDLCSYDDVASN